MIKYTQTEIRSYSDSTKVYIPNSTEVKLISTSIDNICIVEYKGELFSCGADKLGDEIPVISIEVKDINDLNLF